ncbi:MAG: hypothetical protein JNJ90_17955 [Saprospiraceae bacterium]|nr:hypothetical protein [Saprospiraceae bacterium]
MTCHVFAHRFLRRCMNPISGFLIFCAFSGINLPSDGIHINFKGQELGLVHPVRRDNRIASRRAAPTNAQLDTMSNWYSASRRYVEIIRQDHPLQPHYGIALGFEFDAENAEFPYRPENARLQFKDFSWGGVEFSPVDSCNFTGVNNEVSDDLTILVDGYENDTIFGRFSGLLLSAAGPMAQLDSGVFRVFVYRLE